MADMHDIYTVNVKRSLCISTSTPFNIARAYVYVVHAPACTQYSHMELLSCMCMLIRRRFKRMGWTRSRFSLLSVSLDLESLQRWRDFTSTHLHVVLAAVYATAESSNISRMGASPTLRTTQLYNTDTLGLHFANSLALKAQSLFSDLSFLLRALHLPHKVCIQCSHELELMVTCLPGHLPHRWHDHTYPLVGSVLATCCLSLHYCYH